MTDSRVERMVPVYREDRPEPIGSLPAPRGFPDNEGWPLRWLEEKRLNADGSRDASEPIAIGTWMTRRWADRGAGVYEPVLVVPRLVTTDHLRRMPGWREVEETVHD